MKKFLALALALAMTLALVACGGNNAGNGGNNSGSNAGGNNAGGEGGEGKTYKVAMICDSSISDGGWGMSCFNAMVDAHRGQRLGVHLFRHDCPVRLL